MRTPLSIATLSYLISLYLALAVQAVQPAVVKQDGKQLSDSTLFEAHLQLPVSSSHKRLPSDLLNHHEHEDEIEALQGTAAVRSSSATSSSTHSLPPTDSPPSAFTFVPRQPSHFIKHHISRKEKNRRQDSAAHKRSLSQRHISDPKHEVSQQRGMEREIVLAVPVSADGESRLFIMVAQHINTKPLSGSSSGPLTFGKASCSRALSRAGQETQQ